MSGGVKLPEERGGPNTAVGVDVRNADLAVIRTFVINVRFAYHGTCSNTDVPDNEKASGHDPINDCAEWNVPARYLSIDKAVMQNVPTAM